MGRVVGWGGWWGGVVVVGREGGRIG